MNSTTINPVFDLKRFLRLLRCELYASSASLIIILGVSVGVAALVNITTIPAAGRFSIHDIFYPTIVLMIGGLVFSSLTFTRVHGPGNDLRYVTLPASNLEKLASKILLTSVFYVVASLVVYFIATALMSGISLLIFRRAHALFNPFTLFQLWMIGIYIVVQSIFVFGSIFFKRMALAKTILTLMGIGLAFSIIAGIIFTLVNIDILVTGDFWGYRPYVWNGDLSPSVIIDLLKTVPGVIFWGLTAPFFWIVSYFRLKEKEV